MPTVTARLVGDYVQAFPHLYEFFDYRDLFRLSRASLEDRYEGHFASAPRELEAVEI